MDESTLDTIINISYVHLSLDAGKGETYGLLKFGGRSGGSSRFDQALRNLTALVEKKRNTPDSKLDIKRFFYPVPSELHGGVRGGTDIEGYRCGIF